MLALSKCCVRLQRACPCAVLIDNYNRVDCRVVLLDARKVQSQQLNGAHLTRADAGGYL
jgi:hypothetical protein